jgi:hypothetical protein
MEKNVKKEKRKIWKAKHIFNQLNDMRLREQEREKRGKKFEEPIEGINIERP